MVFAQTLLPVQHAPGSQVNTRIRINADHVAVLARDVQNGRSLTGEPTAENQVIRVVFADGFGAGAEVQLRREASEGDTVLFRGLGADGWRLSAPRYLVEVAYPGVPCLVKTPYIVLVTFPKQLRQRDARLVPGRAFERLDSQSPTVCTPCQTIPVHYPGSSR